MASIVLHGDLRRFGERFELNVASPVEAVRALCSQIKGFRRRLGTGAFRIVRRAAASSIDLDLGMLDVVMDNMHELHIVPVIAGSKGGSGSGKAMIGIAIIAAAFTMGAGALIAAGDFGMVGAAMSSTAFTVMGGAVSYAQIAGLGAMMVLGGVSQMLSASPKGSTTVADQNASFVFSGPVNSSEQGSCVPLVYGRFTCGTVVASSDLTAERMQGSIDIEQGGSGSGAALSIASVTVRDPLIAPGFVLFEGAITGLTLISGGNNYANPYAYVNSNTGSNAQIALQSASGVITGYTIVDGGQGYKVTDTVVIADTF